MSRRLGLALVMVACGSGARSVPPSAKPAAGAGSPPVKVTAEVTSPAPSPAGAWDVPTALTEATTIAIDDRWTSFGCVYAFHAALTRDGDRFSGEAKLEKMFVGPTTTTRPVTLGLAPVEALERAVTAAAKQAEPKDEDLVRAYRWSDDFPEGSITFTGPHGSYRIFFRNQQRQLLVEHGPAIDALDYRPPRPDADLGVDSPVWARFNELLASLSGPSWRAAACRR